MASPLIVSDILPPKIKILPQISNPAPKVPNFRGGRAMNESYINLKFYSVKIFSSMVQFLSPFSQKKNQYLSTLNYKT